MKLPFTLEQTRPAQIGVIVLEADETLEPEFRSLLPAPLEVLAGRVPSGGHVLPETLKAMDGTLSEAAGRMPDGARFAAVGYGCTSATAQIGAAKVAAQICAGIGDYVPVSEPVSASLAACRALGVSRIGLVSPYVETVSMRLMEVFAEGGLEVTVFGSFDVSEEARVVRIAGASIVEAATRVGAAPECDAVFLSCTNLRTLAVIEEIEAALGKPVLSSNTALAWHLAQLGGVAEQARIPGALGRLA